MTAFDITKFDMGFGSERYVRYDNRFVARFKYARAAASAKDFVKFLVKNFSVEEYFGLIDGGMTPAGALETKGHINYNIRMAMKQEGVSTKEELLALRRKQTDERRSRDRAIYYYVCTDKTMNDAIAGVKA